MKRFQDRLAFITGPSDHGIGGAVAETMAEGGADLFLFGLTRPDRLIKRLTKRGANVRWFEGDVTCTTSIHKGIEACHDEFGHIDILVNNAGVEFSQSFEAMSDEEWDELLAVNLTGAMKMTRAALKYLTGEQGVIINIASALGMAPCAGFHAYSASKAGLIAMTQSLAMEIAPYGQRALCVAPAIVQTAMAYKHRSDLDQEAQQKLENVHPLGLGVPSDVADVVAFLASDEARWMTGISIPLGWVPTWGLPMPASQNNSHAANTPEAIKAF